MGMALWASVATAEPLKIAELERSEPVDFYSEVLPFLRKNCLACHNETKAKADLILETPESILEGGDTQPSIVPGDAMASYVFTTAAHIEDPIMPPDNNKSEAKNLTPDQLALFKLWIDQGAKSGNGMIAAAPEDWQANPTEEIYSIAVSTDSRFVAVGRGHGIQIYDLGLNEMVADLADPELKGQAHRDFVHDLAWSPDGTLASGGYRVIKLWERPAMLPQKVEAGEVPEAAPLSDEAKELLKDLDLTPALSLQIEAIRQDESMAKRLSSLYGREIPEREEVVKKETEAAQEAAKEIPAKQIAAEEKAAEVDAKQEALAVAEALGSKEEELTKLREELATLKDELVKARRAVLVTTRNRDDAAKLISVATQKVAEAQGRLATADAAIETLKTQREALEKKKAEFKGEVVGVVKAGKVIAVALKEGTFHLYGAETKQHLESFHAPEAIATLALEKGNLVTYTASKQKLAWKLDRPWAMNGQIGDGKDANILQERVTALAYSPDGATLISGTGVPSRSGVLQIWDAESGNLLVMNEEAHVDTITDINFSPDGDQVVTGSTDKFAKVFSAETGEELMAFEAHTGHVLGVAWSHDSRTIATCSADTEVKFWSLETGEQTKELKGWKKEITSVEFLTKANEQVVTSSGEAALKIDTSAVSGAAGFLYDMTVSPDGKWILAGGEDGILRVWTAADRKLAQSFKPPQKAVAQAAAK